MAQFNNEKFKYYTLRSKKGFVRLSFGLNIFIFIEYYYSYNLNAMEVMNIKDIKNWETGYSIHCSNNQKGLFNFQRGCLII